MSKKKARPQKPPMGEMGLFRPFRVEVVPMMHGRKRVLVTACEEILVYSREEIKFLHKQETVCITGKELWCKTYDYHSAEVVGCVSSIAFSGVKHD